MTTKWIDQYFVKIQIFETTFRDITFHDNSESRKINENKSFFFFFNKKIKLLYIVLKLMRCTDNKLRVRIINVNIQNYTFLCTMYSRNSNYSMKNIMLIYFTK